MEIDGFVLVHGGYHGAWCWERVRPLLTRPSVAVDLPGRGTRPPTGDPVTVEQCVAAVEEDASAAGLDRFVLVGHSMGGITITEMANHDPGRVAHLVYLAALALPVRGTVFDIYFPDQDATYEDPAGTVPLFDETAAHRAFGLDLDPAEFASVHARCVPEPVGMFRATVTGYGSGVPSTFVRCRRDGAIRTALAEETVDRLAPQAYHILDSDHDVMLSHPHLVAGVLNDLAAR